MSGVSLGERSFGWSWILRLHVSIKISVCMVTSVLRRWFKPFVLSLTWTCAKESHEILETAGFLFLSGRGAFLESGWLIQFHFGVLRLDIYTFALSRVVFSLLWCWFADREEFERHLQRILRRSHLCLRCSTTCFVESSVSAIHLASSLVLATTDACEMTLLRALQETPEKWGEQMRLLSVSVLDSC